MQTMKMTQCDVALLTAAALGMAGSVPVEQGKDIVISALKNYVRPHGKSWAFVGVEAYLTDALRALACGELVDFWNNVDDAKDKCMVLVNTKTA
jgi:hypothetical protein